MYRIGLGFDVHKLVVGEKTGFRWSDDSFRKRSIGTF